MTITPRFETLVVTPLDYDFLRRALKQHSGLALGADKHYFLESRLLPLARQAGFNGVGDLVLALKTGGDGALMTAAIEATTTSESFFFRDKTPFDYFRRLIMPALLAARRQSRVVRIWCAAAANGQEPYSIAICLREMASAIAGWRIEILATDLSDAVLQRARQGLYSSKYSVGCRLSSSSNISRGLASCGRSLRKCAPWSNIAASIFLRILRRLELSM